MITNMLLLAAAATSTPAPAQVDAPSDVGAWVKEVDELLQHHLSTRRVNDRGLATVSFRRGEDGRPIEVLVTSGSPFISRAALATIRSIKVLPPMPPMMPSNQRITFKLLVGDEDHLEEYEQARATLLRTAKQSNLQLAARLGSATQLADLSGRQ